MNEDNEMMLDDPQMEAETETMYEEHDEQDVEVEGEDGEQVEDVPQQQPQPPVARVDEIVAALQKVMPQQPQQQTEQQPKWTQEDYDRAFKTVKITEDDVEKILAGGKQGLEATMALVQKISQHADALAKYNAFVTEERLKRLLDERVGKVEPVVQRMQERYYEGIAREMQEEYFDKYPEMQQYIPVLKQVRDYLLKELNDGVREPFRTRDEAFSTITELARGTLNAMGISVGSQPSRGGNRAATRSKMTPTLVQNGAGGGSGRSSLSEQEQLMRHVFGE